MAIILDGASVAHQVKAEIKKEVESMVSQGKKRPNLATILVGDDPVSHIYVSHKIKACKAVGFISTFLQFSEDISEEYLLKKMDDLNQDSEIDGYIVQLPLPKHIRKEQVIDRIDPAKDVDGFHHLNFGRMSSNLPCHLPATPNGILELFRRYHIETKGKHVVMVGASHIVGLPMSILLAKGSHPGHATVTLTHIHTVALASHTRLADILIVATGVPHLITADMVKSGAVVIDVGINKIKDPSRKSGYRTVGDVDFEQVQHKASHITPVPKGVGPMTIAALMMNTLHAAKNLYPKT